MKNVLWRIYFKEFDENGKEINEGVSAKGYVREGNARVVAEKLYGDRSRFKYEVAWRNPFVDYFEDTKCQVCGGTYSRKVDHYGLDDHKQGRMFYTEVMDKQRITYRNVCPNCRGKISGFINSLKEGE